jgi:RNA polymerase sigma-70 factor (ECF subfamily)
MLPDESILIKQISDGSKIVFASVYNQYFGQLYVYAMKYVHDAEAAKEIVQDSLIKLWEVRKALTAETRLQPFLFRITRNSCLNHLKHLKVHEKYQTNTAYRLKVELNYSALSHQSAETFLLAEMEEEINKAIASLPQRCREIFELSRNEEKKYTEIASELNISIKTVENQVMKALKILRAKLSEYLHVFISIVF